MNIQQASIYSGKSEKTLRRLIHKGKLPAAKIEGKYDLQASDLDALTVYPAPDTLSERISALEDRVHVLEGLLAHSDRAAPRVPRTASKPSEGSTLPGDLVIVSQFAELHGMAPTTVKNAVNDGRLAAIPGQWKIGRAIAKHAFNADQRAAFYALYHEHPHFIPCADCPHHEP